jgi:hypothetical protein
MTRPSVRLHVESLEGRTVPSGFAFDSPPALSALSGAFEQITISGPPIRVAAVFALNFDTPTADTLHALNGLVTAGLNGPPISPSPVLFGLANLTSPST